MYAFLCNTRPRSVNAKKKDSYKSQIVTSFQHQNIEYKKLDTDSYSIIYYFPKRKTQIDADNLSKPILDALQSTAYDDDEIIRLRFSGIYPLHANDISELNITNFPESLLEEFFQMVDNENLEHILYVEIGTLNNRLYQFGLEIEGLT